MGSALGTEVRSNADATQSGADRLLQGQSWMSLHYQQHMPIENMILSHVTLRW